MARYKTTETRPLSSGTTADVSSTCRHGHQKLSSYLERQSIPIPSTAVGTIYGTLSQTVPTSTACRNGTVSPGAVLSSPRPPSPSPSSAPSHMAAGLGAALSFAAVVVLLVLWHIAKEARRRRRRRLVRRDALRVGAGGRGERKSGNDGNDCEAQQVASLQSSGDDKGKKHVDAVELGETDAMDETNGQRMRFSFEAAPGLARTERLSVARRTSTT